MSANWLRSRSDQPAPQQSMSGFAGQKLVVVGGSSGMGRGTAADVVAADGSAVIIGQDPDRVGETVEALSTDGPAYTITADLADRDQVAGVQEQLAPAARARVDRKGAARGP